MNIIVSVHSEALRAALIGYAPRLFQRLLMVITRLSVEVQRSVKEKLSGIVLHNVTGHLRASINREVTVTPESIMAIIGTNKEYAAIHEYGGTIPAHDIFPRRAQALAFLWSKRGLGPSKDGRWLFKSVHIPDVHMPERSYLRSTLKDYEQRIFVEIKQTVAQGLK